MGSPTTEVLLQQQIAELQAKVSALEASSSEATIFIDNTNLNFTTRKLDPSGSYRMCYKKLSEFLARGRRIRQTRIYYSDYASTATLSAEESVRRSERESFYGWLKFQGFWLKECPLVERTDGTTKEKGLDAAIIKDMERLCQTGATDTIILVAGDLDYREIVSEAQSVHFTPVEVAFYPEFAAKKLIQAATKFVNLTDVKELLRRK